MLIGDQMNMKIRNVIALGLLASTLVACGGPDETGPRRPIARVGTVEVNPISVVLYNEMPGRTLAFERAEVRPEVTGIIRERVFKEGGSVQKGDVLYLIDSELYEASYDSAKASLARAEAAMNVARLKERRMAVLRKRNSISQQDYDEIRAVYLQARAEVASATASVKSAKINLDRTSIQAPISGIIGTSTVSVGTLLATNQASPLTTIYQIDPMNVDLTQAAQELVSLRQRIEKEGNTTVSFKKTNDLNLPVILIMNDGSQYKHMGKLSFIDVGVDASTATMTLRAEFPNPDYTLMPGLFIRAKVQVGVEENALLIPQRSILRDTKGQPYVFIAEKVKVAKKDPSEETPPKPEPKSEAVKTEAVKTEEGKTEAVKTEEGKTEAVKTEEGKTEEGKPEEGKPEEVKTKEPAPIPAKATRRSVELGATYGSNWLVLSGLEPGDNVIVEGLQNVTESADVAIIKTTQVEVPADANYLLKNAKVNMKQEEKLDKVVEEELREENS